MLSGCALQMEIYRSLYKHVKKNQFAGRPYNLYYQIVRQDRTQPKQETIRQTLTDGITSGQYQPGQRLPNDSELVKTFSASRPTVNRALREMQLAGLIERRAG